MYAIWERIIEMCEAPVKGLDGKDTVPPHIYLEMRSPTIPKGARMRLAGTRGPLGHICNVKSSEGSFMIVGTWDRKKVIAFAKKEIQEMTEIME